MATNRGTSILQGPIDALTQYGKNLERGTQQAFADIGQMAKGNFNNAGNSLLAGPLLISGANPDDINRMLPGPTGSQKAKNDAVAAANDQAANDAASLIAAKEAQVASTLAGIVDAQKRTPGRAQTLLTGSSRNNTLLTVMGTK